VAAAARKAGVIVAEAFMYRHHPQTRKVEELVKGGAIGTLRLVRGSFTFSLTRERDVRLDPALGGGSLWDVGGYPISYARLLAEAEPVEVVGWQVLGPTGVDEGFTGQMRFPDGVHAQIDSGFRAPSRTSVEVVGSEGTITVCQAFKPTAEEPITLARGEKVERIETPGDLYLGEVEDMADAVRLGKAPRVSLAESRGNVATIVASLRSAREGRPVML
jgi:xylose dehydrogenase (NAD/NADP)